MLQPKYLDHGKIQLNSEKYNRRKNNNNNKNNDNDDENKTDNSSSNNDNKQPVSTRIFSTGSTTDGNID